MAEDSYVVSLIRKHIRLFSAFLFVLSVIALLILLPLEEQSDGRMYEMWVKVGSEVAKGFLAASAVAFLFDWLLKLDADEQLKRTVRSAVEAGMSTARTENIPYGTALDSLMEVVCLPLQKPVLPNMERFCTLHVYHRFRTPYYGNEVRIALLTRQESVDAFRRDDLCLFYWKVDDPPGGEPQREWLEGKSLKVNGVLWDASTYVEDGSVVCSFKRPKKSPSSVGSLALYELELVTIENCPSPLTLNFVLDRTYVRPTWRVDARAIKAKSVASSLSTPVSQLAKSRFFDAPEAMGTCQIFVNDTLQPDSGVLQFVISRDT